MTDHTEGLPEPLKMGGLKYMRADGSAWGGFASCMAGDVNAFPVVALEDALACAKAARATALEEAAQLCEAEAGAWEFFGNTQATQAADQCAAAIRALSSKEAEHG